MATMPRHGKGTRVLLDEKDLSDFLRTVNVSANSDTADITTFGDNDRSYIPGIKDGTFSFDGLFSASTTAADDIVNFLDGALGGSTKHVLTVDLERSTGGRALMMQSDNTSYDIAAPLDDVVTIAVDSQASNGYAGGRMLVPSVTVASTADHSGSSVNTPGTTSAGGTTGGGLAHFHVTALNSSGTVTLKVQHSTSGSTWADLISSTRPGGTSFARSTVAGTIKEKLRGQIINTSTDVDSVTASIAFSRKIAKT